MRGQRRRRYAFGLVDVDEQREDSSEIVEHTVNHYHPGDSPEGKNQGGQQRAAKVGKAAAKVLHGDCRSLVLGFHHGEDGAHGDKGCDGKGEEQRGDRRGQRVVGEMRRYPIEEQRRGAAAYKADPAHLAHPPDAVADQSPENVGDGLNEEECSPDAQPLRHAEADARRGVIERHDHRESEQRQIADDAGDECEGNVAVVEDERDALADLLEFTGLAAENGGVGSGCNAAGIEVDEQAACDYPAHGHPQRAHVADPRNGKAGQIGADDAVTNGEHAPGPADGGCKLVGTALLHYPDEESVEEHGIGKTADSVEDEREGKVGMGKAEPEKQYMEQEPPGNAQQHDAARREYVGQHSGEPTGEGGGGAVDGENQCGIAGREAQVDKVLRKERLLDAVAGHAEDDGDVAAEQGERHAQNKPVFTGTSWPRRFARGDSEARNTHDRDSSTAIWSLMSAGRLSAARSKAAMLCAKGKLAEISGFRSTLPEAINATACG